MMSKWDWHHKPETINKQELITIIAIAVLIMGFFIFVGVKRNREKELEMKGCLYYHDYDYCKDELAPDPSEWPDY